MGKQPNKKAPATPDKFFALLQLFLLIDQNELSHCFELALHSFLAKIPYD